MQDFRYNAMAPYVMSLTWTLGSSRPGDGHGRHAGTARRALRWRPGHRNASAGQPRRVIHVDQCAFAVSALAYYGGTAEGSIDLSGQQIVMPSSPARSISPTRWPRCIWTTRSFRSSTNPATSSSRASLPSTSSSMPSGRRPRRAIWFGAAPAAHLNGPWNTTDANWNNHSTIWDNTGRHGHRDLQQHRGPVVTLTEPITAGSLYIQGPGYTIEGSSLSLANQGAITNDADATISGAIVSGSLNKWGAGKLTLSGANTYAGPTTVGQGILEYGAASAVGSTSKITVRNGAEVSFASAFAGQTVSTPIDSGLGGCLAHLRAGWPDHVHRPDARCRARPDLRRRPRTPPRLTLTRSSVGVATSRSSAWAMAADQVTFVVAAANNYT